MRTGVFQALKWTMEFCQVWGHGRANLDPKSIHRLVKLGELYEVLVDIMTSAQEGAVAIDLDPKRRLCLKTVTAVILGDSGSFSCTNPE